MTDRLRLGTRGSALAVAQSGLVARALEAAERGLEVELVTITTSGDERPGRTQPQAGPDDKSRFVKEIEEALLAGDIDLAVHSAKDVPGALLDGLSIVGVPERADPRDAICGADSLDALPERASVGTSSLRRRAQLLALRPDLRVEELRGNVDTRLRKLAEGEHDAVVLARAGLLRLGRDEGVPIDAGALTPAPGQGCLALEAREGDERAAELAARLTDRDALTRLTAERAVVMALDATCHTPVGALAEIEGEQLRLSAFVGLPDGSTWIRDEHTGPAAEPAEVGLAVASRLLSAGAADVLARAEAATA
ncbi:MAG: hydroxymethylbilane synthase [Thermoleophilaceae bacterium]|nr:hydroxymethylbilane synthase [Thermoleophilaceae bacterium]